jgi:hypothetical protein
MWDVNNVTNLLKQRSYVGTLVWGRTSAFLGGRVKRTPPQDWVVCRNAFKAIVEEPLFDRAQTAFSNFTCHLSEDLPSTGACWAKTTIGNSPSFIALLMVDWPIPG